MNPRIPTLCLFAVLAAIAAPPFAAAQQCTCPPSNLIHTHATSHVRLANTVADASVGIAEDGQTVAAVSKKLGERSQALLGYLRSQHVERLATNQVSVQPKVHTVPGGPDVTVGYSGNVTVSFRVPADKASELTTNALANGANTIDQVSFSPSDEEVEAARKNLAIEATKSAMSQAEAVAKSVGAHVSGVRDIAVDNGGDIVHPMALQRTMFAAKAQAAPIATEAGDQEITVTVNMDTVLAQ